MKKNKFFDFPLHFLIILFLILGYFLFLFIFLNQNAWAAKDTDCTTKHPDWSCVDTTTREGGSSGCEAGLCAGKATRQCCPPVAAAAEKEGAIAKFVGLPRAKSIPKLIGHALRVILGIMGSVALLMSVWGGIIWLTSGGNPDKIKKAKDILVWATIGLIVIFASYALVDFIIKGVGG